ncbi:hypothetical protein B6V74_13035 [Thioclava sp. F42-5]|uniref:tyrosine-type recombinase/integrase n=1 Tax=Thioclava sp. F42-5 TaxID=1973005 RepID=UPI000B53EB7F|nr:integrase family protein [Thioclava sp. F42-5]OWY08739.1 hypothetical protein B6V74_13035 [Thioclava sp. F42-5]
MIEMSAKKVALTDVALRKMKATGKRYEVTDISATGLRARVASTGEITFILKARDAASKLRTVTLGQFPQMTLKEAREAATRARLDLKSGKDINAEKRARRVANDFVDNVPTLRELLLEYEARFAPSKKTWQPRGPRSSTSGARKVIERVYEAQLSRSVTEIAEEDFARSALTYKRVTPIEGGKKTANGQASRARAYLSPVLDWAAGRKSFGKIGASRSPRLAVVSLENTHDPAADDTTITGKRTRVLTQDELGRVLPLLTFPAPKLGKLRLDASRDHRPIAMRFILLTAARVSEVSDMRWAHLDRKNSVWHKPSVKSTRGGPRSQDLPLSDAAMTLLRSLPGWDSAKDSDLVFPNGTGRGKLDNWDRFQKALDETSKTTGWTRHDLRRTASTLMHSLKVPASTIAQILAHSDPLKHDGVGGAASHYLQLTKVLNNTRDPQEEALATLATALETVEMGATA